MKKKRIVILGAGYGGLRTLKKLQNMHINASLVLINKNNYHCETTSLHEVAAGSSDAREICYPIDYVIDRKQTAFIQDTVLRVDREEKQVILKERPPVKYDYLLIALGFESETFGIEGIHEHALAISDIPSVERIRKHITDQFDAWQQDKEEEHLTIVVGGAGFTSFELLGELTNRLPVLARRFGIHPKKVRVICIEPSPHVLPMFDRKLADYGTRKLLARGVEFVIGRVNRLVPGHIYYRNGNEMHVIHAGTFIWTGGVRGSSVIEASGFNQKRGRVRVNDDLTVPGYPDIMIIGDCSAVIDPESGHPYPTTAQIALQQADCAACNLHARIENRPVKAFVYKCKGTVCSLGRNDAMGEVMGKNLKGYPASFMKKVIENRSLAKVGGVETMLKKGRFSFSK
ncbi:NAD(P)/FAD-dependent oxidoreductase [Sporolactobacillus sp. Y61]|uniref:NAD(P)/FAD-dependent oxidoreductase n=1 Tax=Sporolactobacillus sp. Y61 TaxID=3160863 RepID=A0AAU8IHJ4_9BACL|nr:NAD(P)/FAD-dependent oxidoreductase [Sporolactobacillus sp. THM19-2]RYL94127.1 NAD(P)/FAD-dependent oxidoreductase [Sporolactobacillus sp. THM19-2]